MLIITLKNKNLIGFDQIQKTNEKKIKILFQKKIEKEKIKKVLNFKKNEIIYYTDGKNFKILNLFDQYNKIGLKVPNLQFKDFELYSDSHIFGLFNENILIWKKNNKNFWKNFAKIKIKDTLEKIFILEKSNLMLTTSFFHNKIKLWSFLNERILFCGQSFVKEKIASIGTQEKQDYFAVGTLERKIYLYTHDGILFNMMKHSKFLKKNLGKTKSFPLRFFDRNTLFSGGNGQQISKWDIRIGKTVKYWNGHTGEIEYIASPKNNKNFNSFYLITSDNKGMVKKWDIRNEKEIFSWKFPFNQISSLLWN